MIGHLCHFSFSKYPRVLRSVSQRIVACTGKLVAQDEEWTEIEVEAIRLHYDDSLDGALDNSYQTVLMVKTDAVISIQSHG